MKVEHIGALGPAILAGLLIGGWLGPAYSQQATAEQKAAIRQACRSDFMSNCSGVQPGGREAFQCLQRSDVSALCRSALNAVAAKPATESAAPPEAAPNATPEQAGAPPPAAPEQAAAPPPEMPEQPPGDEGAAPPAVRVRPLAAAGMPSQLRAACRSDFGVHCPGVRPGSAAALRCLQVNAPALSPECRSAVEAMGEGGAPPPAAMAPAPEAAPAPERPPLGPIPPMLPRRAFAIIEFCRAERETLLRRRPPGRRPHHCLSCGERATLVAWMLQRLSQRDQINANRGIWHRAISTARRSRALRPRPAPQASPRRFADGSGRRIRNRCRR